MDKRSTGRRNRKRAQLRNGYAMTLDQLRRSAAVRCLKSASEQVRFYFITKKSCTPCTKHCTTQIHDK